MKTTTTQIASALASAPAAFDINAFDSCSDSETPYEFPLKNGDGVTEAGITLFVLGKHSDVVTRYQNNMVNKLITEQEMAKRNKEEIAPRSIESIRASNLEGALIRVVGWGNVKQPFEKNLMRNALLRNPHWMDQILRESENLGNFTKKEPTSSEPSQSNTLS